MTNLVVFGDFHEKFPPSQSCYHSMLKICDRHSYRENIGERDSVVKITGSIEVPL
jgi:hypothetical protein